MRKWALIYSQFASILPAFRLYAVLVPSSLRLYTDIILPTIPISCGNIPSLFSG